VRWPWACVDIRVGRTTNTGLAVGHCSTMIQKIAEGIKMSKPVTGRVCSTFSLTFSRSVGEFIIGDDVVLI